MARKPKPSKFLLGQIKALRAAARTAELHAPWDLDLARDIGVQAAHEGFGTLSRVLMEARTQDDVEFALAYLPWEPDARVTSNYNWRPFVYRYDVPQEVLDNDFDYQDEDEVFDGYFQYHGTWYHTDQFMRVQEGMFAGEWDGYLSDSMSTGVVIQVSNDGEQYRVGYFVSR